MSLEFSHTTLGQQVLFGAGQAAENWLRKLTDLRPKQSWSLLQCRD